MKNLEVRNLNDQFDLNERSVKGYAILFNHESRNLGEFTEIIKEGAINLDILNRSDIKVYLDHNREKGILARSKQGTGSLTYTIDERGVIYSFDAPDTALGNEVVEGLKRGDYNESSFAFTVEKDSWEKKEDGSYLRYIHQIKEIFDFSIVADGAYSDTYVSMAKRSLDEFKKTEVEIKEIEEIESIQEVKEEPIETVEPIEERKADKEEQKQPIKTKRTMENFSLLKTINDVTNNRQINERAQELVNQGVEEMRKAGQNYSSQIVLPVEERGVISASVEGAGMENVAEDKLNILAPLYSNLVLAKAGATFMTGLVGDVSIPVYSGSNVAWKGEAVSADDGAGAFTEVNLSPKRLTAYIDVTKQFLNQDSNSAEALLRADIVKALQCKLEATILGSAVGSATQPAGLLNGVVADTVAVDYKAMVAMESKLEAENVAGNKYFIVSPTAKADLKTTAKAANTASFLMEGNEVIGYPTLTSSAVAGKGIIFGDFSDYVIGQWGGIEVIVDPYTVAKDGKVRLVINGYFDAKPRRAESFQKKILK